MPRILNRRTLSFTALALAVAFAGVVSLLHTGAVRHYVLGWTREFVRNNYGISLEASALDYNLLRLSARVDGVVIRSVERPDLPPLFQADSASARIALFPLPWRGLTIEDAVLEDVAIQVVVGPDGVHNLPALPASPDVPGEPFPFLIKSLRAEGARLVFEDRQRNLALQLPTWRLEVEGREGAEQQIRFQTLATGSIRLQDRTTEISRIRFEGRGGREEFAIDPLEIALGDSTLAVTGRVMNQPDTTFALTLKADLDAEQAAELAGLDIPVEGRMQADIQLENTLGQLAVGLQIEAASLSAGAFRDLAINGAARWDRAAAQVTVQSLSVQSPDGDLDAQGEIGLGEGASSRATVLFDRLNLELLGQELEMPVRIASRANGRASLDWPGLDAKSAEGEARVQLTPTRPQPSPNVIPLAGSLSATRQDETLHVSTGGLDVLGTYMRGDVSVRAEEQLQGSVQADIADLGHLVSNVDQFLGNPEAESVLPLAVAGPAALTATLSGTLQAPRVAAGLQSDDLAVGAVRDAALHIAAEYGAGGEYGAGRLQLNEARLTWDGQAFSAHGVVGLDGPSPTLDLQTRFEQTRLSSMLQMAGQEFPVEALLNASARVEGTAAQPSISADLSGTGLTAYGQTLGSVQSKVNLQSGKLDIADFRIDQPSEEEGGAAGSLLIGGSYDLEAGTYSLDAQGRDLRLESVEGGDPAWNATVNLDAQGSGSVDEPDLEIRFHTTDLVAGAKEIGAADVTAFLRGSAGRVALSVPKFGIEGTGTIENEAPYPAEFVLHTNQTDLAALGITLAGDQPLTGSLTAEIWGRGAVNDWRNGAAGARIDALELNAADTQIRNEGQITLGYETETVSANAALVSGDSRLHVEGSLPLRQTTAPGELRLDGDINLDTLAKLVPSEEPAVAQGRLNITASLGGSFERLDPTLDLSVQQAGLEHPSLLAPLANVTAEAHLEEGAMRLTSLEAQWAGGTISGSGVLPLGLLPLEDLPLEATVKGPAVFQFDVRGLRLESFPDLPAGAGGAATFTVKVEAPELRAEAVTGGIAFDELMLRYETLEARQEAPATILFDHGGLRIESFSLAGSGARFQAAGGVTFGDPGTLDLQLEGDLDAAVLALLSDGLAAGGETKFQADIRGQFTQPEISGNLTLQDGQLSLDAPSIHMEDLDVRLGFTPERVSIEQFNGSLNGGALTATGGFGYSGFNIEDAGIDIAAENVFLNYPEGLNTLLNANLRVSSRDELIVIGGQTEIVEASYTNPIEINQLLFDYLRSGDTTTFVAGPNPLLSRVRYDVRISNSGPILIDNNVAELEANANLRLLGTYYRPGLTGRVTLEEGGRLFLAENRYLVDRGVIDFTSETRIQPTVDIVARTQAQRRYDIELQIRGGGPTPLATTLTSSSHPELTEPDLISLLLTGRVREELRGQEINAAAEQSLSLITGQIGGRLSSGAQRALGLSEVRIEPSLIAAESDPGARLTIGQNITDALSLVYSTNLADSGDEIWIAQYDVTRRFTTEAVKSDDNTYRAEFRHDLRFGGVPDLSRAKGRRPGREIASVDFRNRFGLSEEEIAERLRLRTGRPYEFFRVREGADKLERELAKEGFLETKVRVSRGESSQASPNVNLVVDGSLGPRVEIAFEGASLPSGIREDVRNIWIDGRFDLQRIQEATKLLRLYFVREGYVESKVDTRISDSEPDLKQVVFVLEPGPRYSNVGIRFQGIVIFEEDDLLSRLRRAKLETAVHAEPQQALTFLTETYRQAGYLDVIVERPVYEFDAQQGSAVAVIAVKEGPRYRIAEIQFQGNQAVPETDLRGVLPFGERQPYQPDLLREALNRIEERYWRDGYNDVVVSSRLEREPGRGVARVFFEIDENQQGIIQRIEIVDNSATSDRLVRTQLTLEESEPLSFERLSQSRKNLYDTGAYSLVDIETNPSDDPLLSLPAGQKPLDLRVRVREVQPYQLRYGAFFDTERGPGIIADLTNRNSLGSARVLGLRTRYDGDEQEARVYFSQPLLRSFPVRSTAVAFVRREEQSTFITDRAGFSVLQELHFAKSLILNYGYRFERVHTFDLNPDEFLSLDERLNIAPLTATFSRETRDQLLDATQGSFTSHAVEYASSKLGTDLPFIKYFGQYFKYLPLLKAREDLFDRSPRKPRLTYAGAVRVGLARGLGGKDLIFSERFFAGGGTTIRGFGQDEVGPTLFDLPDEDPTGGDAVFILNNELRFPIIGWFEGVGFIDVGNVYANAGDFDPFNVRKAGGFGLRVRTPYFLLRADYGFKLDRRPGEGVGAFFFSIGQAF